MCAVGRSITKELMDDTTAESCHQGPLARAHQTQVARGLSKAIRWFHDQIVWWFWCQLLQDEVVAAAAFLRQRYPQLFHAAEQQLVALWQGVSLLHWSILFEFRWSYMKTCCEIVELTSIWLFLFKRMDAGSICPLNVPDCSYARRIKNMFE